MEMPARRPERWVIHFVPAAPKACQGCGRQSIYPIVSMAKTFGPADSYEQALARVEQKLKADPVWASTFFRAMGHGRFYPVRIDAYVEMPDFSEVAHRIEVAG
jgi:hypothetical protein